MHLRYEVCYENAIRSSLKLKSSDKKTLFYNQKETKFKIKYQKLKRLLGYFKAKGKKSG